MTETAETRTVLILEDDALIAMDLAYLVAEAGARVIGPFHRAEAARRSVEADPPDLALIDFNLGDHTSETLALWLGETGVPFVFLTGHSPRHVRSKVGDTARILEKPVSTRALETLIRSL